MAAQCLTSHVFLTGGQVIPEASSGLHVSETPCQQESCAEADAVGYRVLLVGAGLSLLVEIPPYQGAVAALTIPEAQHL